MSQNINALKLGFINYLKEISETTNKEYITTNSDVSIFMYANEFKNYISDELDIDPKILSMSINDILNMDIENGKLVDPDEEEKETGVETESSQDPDSIKDIPSQDNNIQGDPTQTGNNTTIQENGENQTTILNDDSIGQLLNTLFEEDAVKNIIDLDQNGELNEEEIFSFIDTIKGFDGDDENISLEDIISSLQAINEGELSLNKEVNDSNEKDTEEAEQPIISQGTAGATNTSGVSGTRGNYGNSSGNLGISNPSGNQTTQEKTLDNMSKEELNSELNSAQSDLSDKQNNLSAILNGSDSQIAQLQQNVDVAYDIYQEELKNLDEDLAKQVDELKSDIDNKENEIDNKEQEISNQESTVNNAKTAYNNAVSTTKTLKNSLSVLKSTDTSNMTPEQKAEINSKIADLEAKIRNSQKAEENAKTAWDNEKEKLDQLNEEKETLQSELNSLNDQMNSLEEEIAQKYPQIQEFLNAYNDAKDEYDNYKKEAISNAKSEVQSAQNYVNEIQTAINNYENKEVTEENSLSPFAGYNEERGNSLAEAAQTLYGGVSTPGGYCAAGVSKAIEDAFGYKTWGNGCDYGNVLAERNDWIEVTDEVSLDELKNLPAGAIVSWSQYNGGQYGHVFISDGQGNEISDFKSPITTDYYSSRGATYRVFIPA